eukprot:3891150-Pleurochrysis_carterae.AAC.4
MSVRRSHGVENAKLHQPDIIDHRVPVPVASTSIKFQVFCELQSRRLGEYDIAWQHIANSKCGKEDVNVKSRSPRPSIVQNPRLYCIST